MAKAKTPEPKPEPKPKPKATPKAKPANPNIVTIGNIKKYTR